MTIRPIPGWPRYGAGQDGRIYRTAPERRKSRKVPHPLQATRKTTNGCETVNLYHDGRHKCAHVAHVVALAWIGPRPTGLVVDFKNGDRYDTKPENLIYRTQKEKWAARMARA